MIDEWDDKGDNIFCYGTFMNIETEGGLYMLD